MSLPWTRSVTYISMFLFILHQRQEFREEDLLSARLFFLYVLIFIVHRLYLTIYDVVFGCTTRSLAPQ